MEDLSVELAHWFDIPEDQQSAVRSMLSAGAKEANVSTEYQVYNFLMLFKRLIMMGYYASEQVGENVLSYLPVPGRYEACIPAEEVGNVWAL